MISPRWGGQSSCDAVHGRASDRAATEPRKLVYVLAGSTLAQLLVILALGTSLHAVGQHASIAMLITVNTFAGLIGGVVPVPGGLGVVEAGLIAGLTAAGIPQDQAVAAVLIQRFFTSYLPPVWGWATVARANHRCMSPASRPASPAGSGAGRSSTGRSTSIGERPDKQRKYQLRAIARVLAGPQAIFSAGGSGRSP